MPFGPVLTKMGCRWRREAFFIDVLHPLPDTLPTVMQVSIPLNATGEVGFLNYGWWAMDLRPQRYHASLYLLASGPTDAAKLTSMNFSLRSNLTNDVWVTNRISIQNISDFSYTQFITQLINNVIAPNSNNTFSVTFSASETAGSTFYFDLISFFPATYDDRPNGLRKFLGHWVKDMNPTFLRFPGSNNIEGYSTAQRWKWNETIGPLTDTPGRPGT